MPCVVANEMDNDPGDEPTVIESETHSGVTNGITASVAYAPKRHKGSPFLVRLEFTGSVPGGYMKMRDEVLNVTNGEVNRAYPDEGGRPPLDLRYRGLRLGEPGDHHAGGKPLLRR